MATLEKRVQVLFDPEMYARLEAEAAAERMSVGALIRDAVEERLGRQRATAQEALQRLFARSDANPTDDDPGTDWDALKEEALNSPILMDIS